MVKDIKNLSNLLNLNNDKNRKDFDKKIDNVLNILNKDFQFSFEKKDIFIKNNIIKIKTNSDIKFVLFLNINDINKKLSLLEDKLILEL